MDQDQVNRKFKSRVLRGFAAIRAKLPKGSKVFKVKRHVQQEVSPGPPKLFVQLGNSIDCRNPDATSTKESQMEEQTPPVSDGSPFSQSNPNKRSHQPEVSFGKIESTPAFDPAVKSLPPLSPIDDREIDRTGLIETNNKELQRTGAVAVEVRAETIQKFDSRSNEWTFKGDPEIMHVKKIGHGGFGEVHMVCFEY